MPYYVYHGDLVAFASHKNHFSVYVMGKRLTEHRDALGKLNCGKGCIRFKKLEELPLDVLRQIVRDTAGENENAAKLTLSARRSRLGQHSGMTPENARR